MIRRAKRGDISRIQALFHANPDTILPRSDAEIESLIEWFWVAEEERKVVGCCCLEIYSPKIAEIRSVVVDKDFQGRGFGADLIKTAVDEAKRQKVHEIIVITSSPDYFEKLNFKPCLREKYALFYQG